MTTFILPLAALVGWQLGAAAILALLILVLVLVIATFFMTWLRAKLSGATVGFPTLIAMRLRRVPASLIVDARITAVKAGIEVSANDLEAHYLAEGNVIQTVQAIIAADKANISLDWQRACAIDLATKGTGKSVLEAVRTSINPKVIECPAADSGRATIDGVAKDGIQVKARARVTVRSNLDVYGEYSDEDLWGVLELVDLKQMVQGMEGGRMLDTEVSEKGDNFRYAIDPTPPL